MLAGDDAAQALAIAREIADRLDARVTTDPALRQPLDAAGRAIALVSGTNGKTTTTRLLTVALEAGNSAHVDVIAVGIAAVAILMLATARTRARPNDVPRWKLTTATAAATGKTRKPTSASDGNGVSALAMISLQLQ